MTPTTLIVIAAVCGPMLQDAGSERCWKAIIACAESKISRTTEIARKQDERLQKEAEKQCKSSNLPCTPISVFDIRPVRLIGTFDEAEIKFVQSCANKLKKRFDK